MTLSAAGGRCRHAAANGSRAPQCSSSAWAPLPPGRCQARSSNGWHAVLGGPVSPGCLQRLSRRGARRLGASAVATGAVVQVAAPQAPAGVAEVKSQLLAALQGTDRGIFGLPAAKRAHILELITQLEAQTPVPAPTEQLGMCHGQWRLLFSTITITGVKRTKLGLREFVRLGEFAQIIDTASSEAVNVVDFSVAGLSMVKGALTITAAYTPSSPQRVDITFKEATLVPAQLQKLFEANYDLLLGIFNPEGHLDITYLDDRHRVGRDNKGNVFLLERVVGGPQ